MLIAESFKMLLLCSLLVSMEVVVHIMGEVIVIGGNGEDGGDGGSTCVVSIGRNDNDLTASMTIEIKVMTNRARGGEAAVVVDNDNGMGDVTILSIGSIDLLLG